MDKKTEDLIARVMAKASVAAEYTVKKTGEVVNATKLNYKLLETNNAIAACENSIGKLVYAAHKGEMVDENAIGENLAKLDELHSEAEVLRKKIAAGKKYKACPMCGRICPQTDRFCAGCGAEM